MNQGQARRWIERQFGNASRYEASLRSNLSETDFADALVHVPATPPSKDKERQAFEYFLFAGCTKFDRWFAPSPPSVPSHYRQLFRAFAERLSRIEAQIMNAPVFLVHAVRDDLYAEFSGLPLPLGESGLQRLTVLRAELDAIPTPASPVKYEEVLNARSELHDLLHALEAGTLRSHLRTSLPYPLARRPIAFEMSWRGVAVAGRLTPSFAPPATGMLTQVEAPGVMVPLNSTRWQYGSTLVELDFPALVDPSIQVPALQLPAIDVPIDAWPNGLLAAFEITYQACWALRDRPEFISVWVPAPGDFGDLESWCAIPGRADINYIRRAHPSIPFQMFIPATDVVALDLGVSPPTPWFQRCRVLADQYARFGETREAMFWLNVGVEALVRGRMVSAIATQDLPIDLDALDGGPAYWDQARTLVAERFPEIVDEIDWPEGGQKPSLFRQIKYFCKNAPGSPDAKQVQANYSKVSAKRNALFHGTSAAPITIEDVRLAIEGFDWLVGGFLPDEVA